MDVHRIGIKFYLSSGHDVDPDTWFRVFNTWIPVTTDEILIDVADYSHVHNGPVTLLVGHEYNYGIDRAGGELGLLTVRKQPLEGSLEERLQACLARALKACRRLEADEALEGSVRFDGSRFQVTFNDRLNAPNDDATRQAVQQALESVLKDLYGDSGTKISHVGEPRGRLTLEAAAKGEWTAYNLL